LTGEKISWSTNSYKPISRI